MMSEGKNEPGFVESLRLKSEETDMNLYLKSTLGGYTKKSVLEYLSVLRKQQQVMSDTFSKNQQALFEEKETLKRANETLKARLNQVESEYRHLSQFLRNTKFDQENLSVEEVAALKSKVVALEEDLCNRNIEYSKLEQKIEQQKGVIADDLTKIEQSQQEKEALREMLEAEKRTVKEQRESVARLSGTIEEKDDEIKFLNALVSEGKLAELTEKISVLTEQLRLQTEVMAKCNEENTQKADTIAACRDENQMLKQSVENLSKALSDANVQNDKLLLANDTLSGSLQQEYQRSIALMKEKSELSIDRITAIKKRDEADTKIALLELKLRKNGMLPDGSEARKA